MLAQQAEELSRSGVDITSEPRTSEGGTEDEQSENQFDDDDFSNEIGPEEDDFEIAVNLQMEAPQLASLELAGVGKTTLAELHLVPLDLKKKQSMVQETPTSLTKREALQQLHESKSTEDLVERQLHN